MADLIDHVLTLPFFKDKQTVTECIRIREKLNTMFFGKIFKDPHG